MDSTEDKPYSYFYNEQGDYTIVRKQVDEDGKPIAIAIEEEEANFIVTCLNNMHFIGT